MDALGRATAVTSRLLSRQEGDLANAILEAGANPTPETITAMKQAEVQVHYALAALGLVQRVQAEEAAQVSRMMGVGQNVDQLG